MSNPDGQAGPYGGLGRLLTPDDLAVRWQMPKASIYRLTREGMVPVVQLGKRYRYRLAAIEEFEEAGGCPR